MSKIIQVKSSLENSSNKKIIKSGINKQEISKHDKDKALSKNTYFNHQTEPSKKLIPGQQINFKNQNLVTPTSGKSSTVISSHKRNNSYKPESNFFKEENHNYKKEKEFNENDVVLICLKNSIDIISKISEDFEKYAHYNNENREHQKSSPYKKPSMDKKQSIKFKKESENPNWQIRQTNSKKELIPNSDQKFQNIQNLAESEKYLIANNIVEYSELRMKNYTSLFNIINTSLSDIKDCLSHIGNSHVEEHYTLKTSNSDENALNKPSVNAISTSLINHHDNIQSKRDLYKNSKNYRNSLNEMGYEKIKDRYGIHSKIQDTKIDNIVLDVLKSKNDWVSSPKFNIQDDISKIEENEEFQEYHNLFLEMDEYECEDYDDCEDDELEDNCDFSEKEMLENVSALPLKLLNINHLDYSQLREMIRRNTRKKKSTIKRTLKKLSAMSINDFNKGKDYLKSKYNQVLSTEKDTEDFTKEIFLTIPANVIPEENVYEDNILHTFSINDNKKIIYSDQTQIERNPDLTTNFHSSYVNINASSLSDPKVKHSKASEQRQKDRCIII